MDEIYKVLVRTDSAGRIIEINSSAFVADTTVWVQIDEGVGDKYHHALGNYLPQSVMTELGVYRYKLADGHVMERTAEEIAADIPTPYTVPTQLDRVEAQVAYTAMMTDTLLEV